MCHELAEAMLIALRTHSTIRNPNAFAVKIAGAGHGLMHLFFRTRPWEQRPVHESDGGLTGRVLSEALPNGIVYSGPG